MLSSANPEIACFGALVFLCSGALNEELCCFDRDFMMTAFNLTEDQAITAITVGVDFSVSQVSRLSPASAR